MLPSVRVLACKYAINPNTIAKAYRELEEEGFIYTQSGKGTFVADANNARQSRAKHLKLLFDQVVTELFVLDTPVEEFNEKLATVAELAVGDACTGSNPRAIDPEQMAKLLTCCFYDTEVDF